MRGSASISCALARSMSTGAAGNCLRLPDGGAEGAVGRVPLASVSIRGEAGENPGRAANPYGA